MQVVFLLYKGKGGFDVAYVTFSKNFKGVAVVIDHTLFPHFDQFPGQCAAVGTEIFRQFHSAKGTFKITGRMILSLNG